MSTYYGRWWWAIGVWQGLFIPFGIISLNGIRMDMAIYELGNFDTSVYITLLKLILF